MNGVAPRLSAGRLAGRASVTSPTFIKRRRIASAGTDIQSIHLPLRTLRCTRCSREVAPSSFEVASSADAIKVQGNLHDIGLPASTFDVVIDGSHVSRKKPAPDLFLEASRLLGLLPEQCFLSSRMPLRDSRRPRPLARDAWRLARGSLPNGSPRPTGSPPNLADV